MLTLKLLGTVVFALLCTQVESSANKTTKEWAIAAQKTIWETSQVFHRASIGLGAFKKGSNTQLLSIPTAKLAGLFGVAGALFSIVMAFIPAGESPELKFMKSEFGKMSQKVDTIARSIDETKDLIKLATQKAAYIKYEQNIHHGYTQMEACLKKLGDVTCTGRQECRRKKILIAEGYIASMNVHQSIEAILRGTTTNSAFGASLLDLLKEHSKCNVPKINLFTNKVIALVTKGMTVSTFYDLLTKTDYNVLDGSVQANKMLYELESKRQTIQGSCFQNIGHWMRRDIINLHEISTSDIQITNTKILKLLKTKYPWIHWHVFTYKDDQEPVMVAAKGTVRRFLYSSSKEHKVHVVVIPTADAKVEDFDDKIKRWVYLMKYVSVGRDLNQEVDSIEKRIERDPELSGQVQSISILPGHYWLWGYYQEEIKHRYINYKTVNSTIMNVFASRSSSTALTVVSFYQSDYPPKCSKRCNNHGKCYTFPYSTLLGCRCKYGYSGETCESSQAEQKLPSVINSIFQKTMKLPTFASIQHTLEDVQLYLKTSTANIKDSIKKLEEKIEEQLKSLGEFMSKKFDWIKVLLKYKDAIENLNYFHSISKMKTQKVTPDGSTYTTNGTEKVIERFSMVEERDIARFLLTPIGIQKWLYQINFLIVGRRDSQLNSHKPLIFMVMDKYKSRLCYPDYKNEITRTYRQLMLLQLRGYMLWSNAYSSVNRDSSAISERYTQILKIQQKYLQESTRSIKIANSKNLENCTGGFYIYKSMKISVVCKEGYFTKHAKGGGGGDNLLQTGVNSLNTTCEPCKCDTSGSDKTSCDSKGQCLCKDKFYGQKCSKRDCKMTKWTAWSPECRCGYADPISRHRSVSIQPVGKGKPCPSSRKESARCTMKPCDCKKIRPGHYGDRCSKRDCELTKWSSWSNTCGCPKCRHFCKDFKPNKSRSRKIKISKVGGGKSCYGNRKETTRCAYWCEAFCIDIRINCFYRKRKS